MAEASIEKFLCNELALPPFNLDFTVASFGNLSCAEMIQLLTLIMTEVDPDQGRFDLSQEDEETTLSRVIEFLRVLKYQTPHDDPRIVEGILNGDPEFLVPIMAWLLSRKEDLKIRAYLPKFLVRIPVPEEAWWADAEVNSAYQKYEALLDEFKAAHKRYSKLQRTTSNVSSLLTDMHNMEHDIECIQRKLDGMKFRMNENGQTPFMLKAVHDLRLAELKIVELADEERNEEQIYAKTESQKVEFHNLYLEECNACNLVETGQELLDNAIEENNRLRTFIQEKGPHEYDLLRRRIHALELVDEQPPESNQHMNCLKDKVRHVADQIFEVQNQKRIKNSSEELFLLRQKANALHHKKMELRNQLDPAIERLTSTRSHIRYVLGERNEKRAVASQLEQDYIEYLEYVQKKNEYCAQLQAELTTLKKETGILSSTKFIVDGQWRETEKELEDLEVQLGLSGFYEDPARVLGFGKYTIPEFEEKKEYLYEMTKNVKTLMQTLKIKKECLEPLLNDVNQARQQETLLQMDRDVKKQNFDAVRLSLESGNRELQAKIELLKKEWETNQFKLVQLKCLLAQLNVTRFRVTEESVNQSLSFRGFRAKLTVKILEQERIQKQLENERAELDQILAQSNQQKQLWGNVVTLLQWKRKMSSGSRISDAHPHAQGSPNYLFHENSDYNNDDETMEFF